MAVNKFISVHRLSIEYLIFVFQLLKVVESTPSKMDWIVLIRNSVKLHTHNYATLLASFQKRLHA